MYHELSTTTNESSFITLTYDDQHLPANQTLVKPHPQNFLKRLRKRLEPQKIRYYLVGEYGDTTQRPHYHAILFGHGLSLDDRLKVMESWPFCDWHQPSIRNNSFALAEAASIQYVAGYVQKKLYGENFELMYQQTGRINPFHLSSKGIGRDYADNNATALNELQQQTIHGTPHTVPRYYIKRLNLDVERLKQSAIVNDCERTERFTGIYVPSDELYKSADKEVLTYFKADKGARKQKERNHLAKLNQSVRSKL